MKKLLFIVLLHSAGYAQHTLTGTIVSKKDNAVLPGVALSAGSQQTLSDENGRFTLTALPKGKNLIVARSFLFSEVRLQVDVQSDTSIKIAAAPFDFAIEEHMISATRAGAHAPIAFSEIDKEEISKIDYGMDMPYLLNFQPSVVATSDAGNNIGYSGLRIRGTDASRINVTVNGIPFNDAESHQVYWVDVPDIASSVDNVQIQRGVGTSTNGAASFGGSINVKTTSFSISPYVESSHAAGSFNTMKNNLSFGTGLLNDKWFFEGRLSRISSDGYVDRASSDLKSFFISTGYSGKKSLLRATVFSGKEITYQSWNGVPESRIKNDEAGMQEYILRNFTTDEEAENLLNSGRTYNYYTYKNQVDDYQQDHYQLHYSTQPGRSALLSVALHYTYGRGFYEEFKYGEALMLYGLEKIVFGNDTIKDSDLVRRKWLDNDFYGATASLTYDIDNRQRLIIGGSWNRYEGRHFHELTWMQFAAGVPPGFMYYSDTARKDDANAYAKYTFNISGKVSIYIDQQVRNVIYEFNGLADSESNLLKQTDSHTFFNPKGGIYIDGEKNRYYFSAAMAHKEPNRSDYKESTSMSRPRPERLTDFEAGWQHESQLLKGGINIYYMNYKDQLVLTGALNDVGNYTRTNVPESYRMGIELTAETTFKRFSAGGNLTLSRNKISDFTEYITNYDDESEIPFIYKNTDIAFSPAVISTVFAGYNPFRTFTARIIGKYVGEQFLDNTQSTDRKLNPYSLLDLHLSYSITPTWIRKINFSIALNNILNKEYISNGYTFGYLYYGKMVRENMYYPQAGFNFMARVNVGL